MELQVEKAGRTALCRLSGCPIACISCSGSVVPVLPAPAVLSFLTVSEVSPDVPLSAAEIRREIPYCRSSEIMDFISASYPALRDSVRKTAVPSFSSAIRSSTKLLPISSSSSSLRKPTSSKNAIGQTVKRKDVNVQNPVAG